MPCPGEDSKSKVILPLSGFFMWSSVLIMFKEVILDQKIHWKYESLIRIMHPWIGYCYYCQKQATKQSLMSRCSVNLKCLLYSSHKAKWLQKTWHIAHGLLLWCFFVILVLDYMEKSTFSNFFLSIKQKKSQIYSYIQDTTYYYYLDCVLNINKWVKMVK